MRHRHAGMVVASVLVIWALGLLVPGVHVALLYAAPAVVLALFMLTGRYPGERVLERLARKRRPPVRSGPVSSLLSPRSRMRLLASGGRLLAASLAGRGPPRPA